MKTPRFLVAACVSLALAFTFSCSSDSSDDPLPVQSSSSNDGEVSSSSGGGGSSSSDGGSSSSSDVSSSSSSDVGGSSNSSDDVSSSSSAEEPASSSSAVPQRTLTINIDPTAGGTVTRNPDKATYDHGTEVIVTAEPEDGYAFAGWWSGSTQVEAALQYDFVMDGNKTLTAKFALIPPNSYSLEIHVNDVHGGTVHRSPSAPSYESGTSVSVTAVAEYGYEFTGWSGAATGTANPVTITMDENKDLTANFALASWAFIDIRDGQIYKQVEIGGKFWMAQNLNYDVPGVTTDVCYDNNASNCETYGRLYNWATAMDVCPPDWHLPSNAEWDALTTAVGSNSGTKLMAASGWSSGNGTDDFGFSALPGGCGSSDGSFYDAGYFGLWWSSSENEYDSRGAYYRAMSYNYSYVGWNYDFKTSPLSVRCVQD